MILSLQHNLVSSGSIHPSKCICQKSARNCCQPPYSRLYNVSDHHSFICFLTYIIVKALVFVTVTLVAVGKSNNTVSLLVTCRLIRVCTVSQKEKGLLVVLKDICTHYWFQNTRVSQKFLHRPRLQLFKCFFVVLLMEKKQMWCIVSKQPKLHLQVLVGRKLQITDLRM